MGPIRSVKRLLKLSGQRQVEVPGMLVQGIGLPTQILWQYSLLNQFSALVMWLATGPFSNTFLIQAPGARASHGFSDFEQLIVNNDPHQTSFTTALENIARLSYVLPHQTTAFPSSRVFLRLVGKILQHHISDCRCGPQVGVSVLTLTPCALCILSACKKILLLLGCLFITCQSIGTLQIC